MKTPITFRTTPLIAGLLVSLLAVQIGCAEDFSPEDGVDHAQDALEVQAENYAENAEPVFWVDIESNADALQLFADGVAIMESPDAFRQVSWMMDAEDASALEFRAHYEDGAWSHWQPVTITFHEGIFYNASIVLDEPATALEMRGGEEILNAQLEFYEEVVARPEPVTADPHADDLGTVQQAVAPSSLVIPRSSWGAVNPNKVCGNVVNPYRIAIHHTAQPSSDGGDPAARMRQMQSFHLNDRGWCDIGYHFVVAQSGQIFQGRSRSNRPGAHVGGQNSGNVGIALIGNYSSSSPSQTQMNSAADIMKWASDTHGIPLNRSSVLGHREHPGQSTACPGATLLNQLDSLVNSAAGSSVQGSSQPTSSSPGIQPTAPANTTSTNPGTSNAVGVEQGGCMNAGGSPLNSPLVLLMLAALAMVGLRRTASTATAA